MRHNAKVLTPCGHKRSYVPHRKSKGAHPGDVLPLAPYPPAVSSLTV